MLVISILMLHLLLARLDALLMLSRLLASFSQFVDSPTYIAVSTLDHVYFKNGLQGNNFIKVLYVLFRTKSHFRKCANAL